MARNSDDVLTDERRPRDRARERANTKKSTLGMFLAPFAIAAALAGTYFIYRFVFPEYVVVAPSAPAGEDQQEITYMADGQSDEQPSYQGVEDPWTTSGLFTVGDAELDLQVKAFCDAFSGEETTNAIAAQTVYNNICWGNYLERPNGEKPIGVDWIAVAARSYFSSANPAMGEVGEGDFYEYAAVLGMCLGYFGYTDVTTVPVISYTAWGEQSEGALCVVVDSSGVKYVCDPSQGTAGWMLEASTLNFVVDNIGQDLSTAESLGLEIVSSDEESANMVDDYGTDGGYVGDEYGYDTYDYY